MRQLHIFVGGDGYFNVFWDGLELSSLGEDGDDNRIVLENVS